MIKMLAPDAPSIVSMSKQEGISEATLYNWRTKLRQQGRPVPTTDRNNEQWTAQAKFAIIVETAALNEADLALYCRGKGLYPAQVKTWRELAVAAQNGQPVAQAEQQKTTQSYQKKIKELQREVDRKNKALAEAAALLVLQKKLRAL
ncbi:IS3 family transposase, partial [Undibacterium sp. CCC2.1]|nr:IS3 family transposase [Undibacterium sp. CCC2.1]MEB0174316.1 IS3 family transposase [Undibacterium sp. CCC1.1]MEB0178257.1 IS3 family transposase [Undibacterium sp. CCC3.4]